MSAETIIRLQRQEQQLEELKEEIRQIKLNIQEALKNGDYSKFVSLDAEHRFLASQYFVTKQDVEALRFICDD